MKEQGDRLHFSELIPETTLPRWSAATTGWCISEILPQCPTCKRDGYYNIPKAPLRISYDQPVPTFAVAQTYEHFGKSRLQADFRKSLFAPPYLIVGKALEDVLAGERGLEFVPVSCSGSTVGNP